MTVDLMKLKLLATATATNQHDPEALNDYGAAVPPATVLVLIAEIERHRQVKTEGCKPDSNMSTVSTPAEVQVTQDNVKPLEMTIFRAWLQHHSTVGIQVSGVEAA